ncbi:MAG TPA: bifunctional (p)ppGpp synthetase/guanosine-3',5'-bis(diphosphate) 3'-pyrophosphohydrolase [Desulfobacterales bacterium]|nr:MAG: GTP pyrophosphokinase [Deltaproteobacteria bacterium]HHC25271.1 bifunctional (p)ppGpp synthetase/guanosine-3',5'-bis(diphosphate) 3'-pyrophosphohydrolase [Desulfobacterales bacterium]
MIRITDILDKIGEHNPNGDIDIVDRAYIYSARVHEGQMRLSGEPYLSHPLEVAGILADMRLDTVSIASALLHDVIEDTHATGGEIKEMFGQEVCHIVSGVTKLSKIPFHTSQARQAESLRKMLLAMADDIRVILIKLADRLHNMRTLKYHRKEEKKITIAQETLDIYAPLASRLGIYWMKRELEDMSFMYLNPGEYERIKGLVSKDKEEREGYIEMVNSLIRKEMKRAGLKSEVLGRYKHFYSIYQKMTSQDLAFEDVYDIIAFRIILDTKPQCYESMGFLHALWKPIDIKFKDYIGRPKPNMYQSLHTTVVGPSGERIEIQIRTREMDNVAKSGIAAHWGYKEGKPVDENVREKFAWIQNLIENQENTNDPNEFLENVRIDLFPDEVYVFTPQGEIKCLPKGGTPVDFAYLIHSEVGNQCTSAKVNGRIVPLRHALETGDVVVVITSNGHHPSRDWLSFVKTVKARNRIKQWIKTQDKERSISLGREMCEKAFRKHRLNYNALIKSEETEGVLEHFGLKTVDDLIANVGYGKITPLQIIRKVTPKSEDETLEEKSDSILNKLVGHVKRKKPSDGVSVKGVDDILIRFGKCCQPVPGDTITGYITRGYGVTVHKTNCINALKMNSERQIEVEWDADVTESYPVKIRVLSHDRVGLLADLAVNISKNGANILNVNSQTRENKVVDSFFTLAVKDTDHLRRVMSSIRKIKQIMEVKRIHR